MPSKMWDEITYPFQTFYDISLYVRNYILGNIRIYLQFLLFSDTDNTWVMGIPKTERDPFIPYNKYHACWWHGDPRGHGFSSHIIDPGGWFNIKMPSYRYRKFHCGDKTILRPSYLHNGIPYTGKMKSLYWIRAQVSCNIPAYSPITSFINRD